MKADTAQTPRTCFVGFVRTWLRLVITWNGWPRIQDGMRKDAIMKTSLVCQPVLATNRLSLLSGCTY